MKQRDKWILAITLLSIPIAIVMHLNYEVLDWEEIKKLKEPQWRALVPMLLYSLYPWIAIYFGIRYHHKITDWYRNRRESNFQEMSDESKRKLLNNQFCENCERYSDLGFQRVSKVSSMKFIHGKCTSCSTEMKVRIE